MRPTPRVRLALAGLTPNTRSSARVAVSLRESVLDEKGGDSAAADACDVAGLPPESCTWSQFAGNDAYSVVTYSQTRASHDERFRERSGRPDVGVGGKSVAAS